MIVCAIAAAIAGAGGVVFMQGKTLADDMHVVFAGQTKGEGAAASEPAATRVAGEPGEGPRPKSQEPGAMMDRAGESSVYVDDSFDAVSQLKKADRYADQGQNQPAITTYQEILTKYGRKLLYLNNDSYISVTDYVRGRLLAMPAVKDGMYDQLFGVDAKSAIDVATQNRDLAELIRTCDRFFPSTAALEGISRAADWYFERGEFSGASRLWALLMTHPMATADQRGLFLFRAAVAESLQGNKAAATKMRDRLAKEFPDVAGAVDGQNVTLVAAADEVLGMPAMTSNVAAPDEWPAFDGGPTHSKKLNVDSSVGARLWSVDLNDEAVTGDKTRAGKPVGVPNRLNRFGQQEADPNYQALNSYPVLSNGMLFIHTGERLVAMSINAGSQMWAYPEHPISKMNTQQAQQMAQMYGQVRGWVSHDSAAVSGDQVFAVLPARDAPPPADEGRRRGYYGPQVAMNNTRVVCLNRQNGEEIWSTLASNIKLEKGGVLTFCGSPIVTQQGVFTMARKSGEGSFTELYLVRLDRDTGAQTWACYLCSASSGNYYQPMMSVGNIPIPTIVDDIVYISTGQGADCAVDANAGRILWLQITEAAKQHKTPEQMYNPSFNTAPSWKFNPPLVSGDKLVTCETAEAVALVRVYNRWTGKPLKTITKKDLGVGSLDILAGIYDSKAIIVGTNVLAIDINAGSKDAQPVWTVDFPSAGDAGKPLGRPFMAEAYLYVPFEKGLLQIDLAKGSTKSFWLWPKTEKDVPGKSGNLLVTSEQVVVLNDNEVAGYSKWETARDNRLAKIKEHPSDPEAYLALAEISFRTEHYPLAEENMKQAVQLACVAPAGGAGTGAPAEIVGRMYRTNLNFAQQLLVNTNIELRDRARFYYEQCKIAARDAEQQAEWRLCMSDLSLAQRKPEEAATLYNEVLTDPNLRSARFRRTDALARAGVVAEDKFRLLITKEANGPAIYKRFEDQAAAILNKARAGKDKVLLAQVIDSYPNSASAIDAATDLATAARETHDPGEELKALYWLLPRVSGEKKAAVTAETAEACITLPKPRYGSAIAWTERGLREYKDFKWTNPVTKEPMTFALLREALRKDPKAALAEGRVPSLPPLVTPDGKKLKSPNMDLASVKEPLAVGNLMVPVEQSTALRRPDLLFVMHNGAVHIFSTTNGTTELTKPQTRDGVDGTHVKTEGGLALPDNSKTVLVGCVGDIAVLAQGKVAYGINLKNPAVAWTMPFVESTSTAAQPVGNPRLIRQQQQLQQLAMQRNGNFIIQNGVVIDANTGQVVNSEAMDPELARQFAYQSLGRPNFSTLRILNDKLIVASGDKLYATNISTGKPTWPDASGNALAITLTTEGTTALVTGNEDVIIAEIETANRLGPTYVAIDAETGRIRKQIKLPDEEHAQWRAVSEDGIFFVVSDRAVAAYDLFSDNPLPVWRRTDLRSNYPNASVLTLDGLVFVKGTDELLCLSLESGEVRWPTAGSGKVNIAQPAPIAGQTPFLRSTLVGDTVVFQSATSLEAYFTPQQAGDERTAWKADGVKEFLPPLNSMQVSDAYVVVLAEGPAQGAHRKMTFVCYTISGGRMCLKQDVLRSTQDAIREAPGLRSWQLADNGIAMEVDGAVKFFHGAK